MRAGKMQRAGAIQHIVEATTDDDMFIKSGMWNESGVGLDGEGKFVLWLPMSDDLEKRDLTLKRRMTTTAEALFVDHCSNRTGETDVVDPLRRQFFASNSWHFIDVIPHPCHIDLSAG